MPRLKFRSMAFLIGACIISSYLLMSVLQYDTPEEHDYASQHVLSILHQIYDANLSVLPNQSTVILEPSPGLTCHDNGSGLNLLFIVITAPANYGRRDVIRATFNEMQHEWERYFYKMSSNHSTNTTRLYQMLFFVGQPEGGITDELRTEWDRYGDMIIDDMQESYLNLTVKTLRMLKWVMHNCGNANYLVKIDDDVFLDIPKLLVFLESHGNPLLVAGHRYDEVNVDRDPSSKWYTPVSLWRREKFPTFVAGFCYIMGVPAARKMYDESFHIPLFHLEDVFLTGIIGTDRLHLKLTQLGDVVTMLYWYHYMKPVNWQRNKAIIHGVSPNQFQCWTRNTVGEDDDDDEDWWWDTWYDWWPNILTFCQSSPS